MFSVADVLLTFYSDFWCIPTNACLCSGDWSTPACNSITPLVIQWKEILQRRPAESERERERQARHVSEATTNVMSRQQMNRASISSLGQKMLHNSKQNIYFLCAIQTKSEGPGASLSLHLLSGHPLSQPCLKFHLENIFLPFPHSHMLSTTLALLCLLWIQYAVALWFTCLTNMDRGPKWFLKSSNGLGSARSVLGGNAPSLCLSFPLSHSLHMCVTVRACQVVYLCLCLLRVCVRACTSVGPHPRALLDSHAGRWQRSTGRQSGNEIRMSDS